MVSFLVEILNSDAIKFSNVFVLWSVLLKLCFCESVKAHRR